MAASDPQPVFDLIAESATKLCGGEVCTVTRFDGEWVHLDAIFGSNSAGIEALRRTFPMQPSDAGGAARAIHQCADCCASLRCRDGFHFPPRRRVLSTGS